MFTPDQIQQLRNMAYAFRLDVPEAFWIEPLDKLQRIFNGCGADWMPRWCRWLLTLVFWKFLAPFLIHDWEFDYSDGTRSSFTIANKRLYRNCLKVIGSVYSWLTEPALKLRGYVCSWIVYRVCQHFGWSAWRD
ncbi:MAG: hypothetical protein JXR78_16610 [Victivallales bacterium]|nr:hypothetical protein [Victivallales bacterium]